jgi:olefin beta-lactone synthetase
VNANVAVLLAQVAATRPDAPALLRGDGSTAWTAGGLAASAAQGAGRITARGIGPGDSVLVLARAEDAVVAAAAVLWSGAAILFPPRGLGLRAALRAASGTRPRAVVASAALWPLALLEPALLGIPKRFVTGSRGLPGIEALAVARRRGAPAGTDSLALKPPAPAGEDDPAAITYTTGTTGHPRPIVRTHGVLRGQHDALDRLRPARPGDIDLAGLPMLVLHDLARGVPAVLLPSRTAARSSGRALAATVRRLRVTTASGFPTLFEDLVRFAPPDGYRDLRAIHVGGAPVAVELLQRLRSAAPNATVTVVYGATEAEPIAAIGAGEYVAAATAHPRGDGICVGRPVAGLATRLVALTADGDGSAPATGRLQVRGPQVAATDGGAGEWREVGDLARIDLDGRVWLLGRASNAIAGIPPLAIEQAVEAVPGVRAAAVAPAGAGLERNALAIETAPAERSRVLDQVERLVAKRGWPLDVVAVGSLPRERRSGKVDSRLLARLLSRTERFSRRGGSIRGAARRAPPTADH